ncbi:thiamine phosphate synthase [Corynebacterium tapiri]|nr:thiamine phosphate synthase [Corynebacterium tapiri]
MTSRLRRGIYLVTDPHMNPVVETVRLALGVDKRDGSGPALCAVQIRDKHASDADVARLAEQLAPLCAQREVPLFINDRVAVAQELGLHVHIGQGDAPFAEVRESLPPECMVGLSAGNAAEIAAAGASPVMPSYLGIGPVYSTATKADAPSGLGVDALAQYARQARELGMPSVAIGGIAPENARAIAPHVDAVCVVSAIMAADDPAAATAALDKARAFMEEEA